MPDADRSRSSLDQRALQDAAGWPWSVQLHEEASSTNELATAQAEPNLVVVADHQTAGRGRLDRTWETPAGAALTFSAVVEPVVDAEWWPVVPLLAGYAVARALGPFAQLKWPNDVLVEDQKVCGILVELVPGRRPLAVIGIGINVDQTRTELPVPTATSLALVGHRADRTVLLGAVLHFLHAGIVRLAKEPHSIIDSYRARCATLGRDVRVELPDGSTLEGRASDIDDHGRLTVLAAGLAAGLPAGVSVSAGDVVHVRTAQ